MSTVGERINNLSKALSDKGDREQDILLHQVWLMKIVCGTHLFTELTAGIRDIMCIIAGVAYTEHIIISMHDILLVLEEDSEFTAVPHSFLVTSEGIMHFDRMKSATLVPYLLHLCCILQTAQVATDGSHTINYDDKEEAEELYLRVVPESTRLILSLPT